MLKKAEAHLEITIEDGKVVIDGHGFEGQGCHELSALFTEALGDVTESKRKPDYFKGGASGGLILGRVR